MQAAAASASGREEGGLIEMGDEIQYEERVIRICNINVGIVKEEN